jgi:hypothetical protein
MTAATYSRGPWQVKSDTHIVATDEDGVDFDVAVLSTGLHNGNVQANGRLIAAAPELAQAVKAATEGLEELVQTVEMDAAVSEKLAFAHSMCANALVKAGVD